MIEKRGDIATTDQYWDCKCEKNFIHPKEFVNCAACGSFKDDQPDSMVNELLALGFSLPDESWNTHPTLIAKKLGLDWIRENIDPEDKWPEDQWVNLSVDLSMNVYVDMDENASATIFPILNGTIDLEDPIEVI